MVAKPARDSDSRHIIEEIAELLPGSAPIPERVREVIRQTKFQGPIPPPQVFREYGQVVADAPERILKVFEEDSQHARAITMAALNAQAADNRRVHWMAWSFIAGGYGLSALFAWMNKDVLSGIILSTTIVGTITGFLQARKSSAVQDDEKD